MDQNKAISNYLEALEGTKARRGRRRTEESMRARLAAIAGELDGAKPMNRLLLIQERADIEAAIEERGNVVDISVLEAAFCQHAAAFSERKGISSAAWTEMGVPAAVRKRAGI